MSSVGQIEEVNPSSSNEAPSMNVIFVHGIHVRSQDELPVRLWCETISRVAPHGSRILHYNIGLLIDHPANLREIRQRAIDPLCTQLYTFCQIQTNITCPLIFCCHGLGGIAVKQVLLTAYNAAELEGAKKLISLTDAIIFLGTPHWNTADPDLYTKLRRILRLRKSESRRECFESNIDDIGLDLSGLEPFGLQISVLSCFETISKEFGRRRIHRGFRRKKTVLVDGTLASTSWPGETLVAMDRDLDHIFDTPDSQTARDVAHFFEEIPQRPHDRSIENARLQYHATVTQVSSSDYAESDSVGILTSGSVAGGLRSIPESSPGPAPLGDYFPELPNVTIPCRSFGPYFSNRPRLFGREDILGQIDQTIFGIENPQSSHHDRSKITGVKSFLISGPGGFGKTQIAIEYMLSRMDRFEAIAWLDGDSTSSLERGYSKFAVDLGLVPSTQSDQRVNKYVLFNWFSDPVWTNSNGETRHVRWLIIMDDVKNADDLADFWPRQENGAILVTGRSDILASRAFLNIKGIDLHPLAENEAAQLLQWLLADQETLTEATPESTKIVQSWNCVPLAIVFIARVIQQEQLSLIEFISYQETRRRTLLVQLLSFKGQPTDASVLALGNLQNLDKATFCLFGVISFLDNSCISEELLFQHPEVVQLPHYPNAATWDSSRKEPLALRLIERNADRKFIYMHSLVQEVVKAMLETPWKYFNAAVRLLLSDWPAILTPEKHFSSEKVVLRWDKCDKLLPHTTRLAKGYQELQAHEKVECATREFALLLAEASWYLKERGVASGCLELLDLASSVYSNSKEDMPDILSAIHNGRGAVAMQINQPKDALDHYKKFKELQEKFHTQSGKFTTKFAASYSELGMAYLMNEVFTEETLELFDKSAAIRKKVTDYNKMDLYNTLRGKGLFYWHSGKYEEALECLLEALHDRENFFGSDDHNGPRTGHLLVTLGDIRRAQKLGDASLAFYERALAQFIETVGEGSINTADVRCKIAVHFIKQEKFEKSRPHLEKAIQTYRGSPYFSGEVARATYLLSKVLSGLGKEAESRDALEQAAKIRNGQTGVQVNEDSDLEAFDRLVVFWKR